MSAFSNWNGSAAETPTKSAPKYVDPLQELIDTIKMSPEAQRIYDAARFRSFTEAMCIRKQAAVNGGDI